MKKSPRNARKTPHPQADIEALAASIAAHGMLQSPVVEPELQRTASRPATYLVTIGEGRRQAQLLRAKRKEITKTEPIRCIVETAHDAFEISLAENAIRSPMHPADQFEAFHALHTEKGMSAEDIAARFGVTPAVVRQRLKLAAVSPKLMELYRKSEMNLEQLTAFAITDDHARQEAVWEEFGPGYGREEILAALNGEHVPADDRRAVFVGLEAYQAAGGIVLRDLFDDDHKGFLTDAGLLLRLAQEKLQAVAATVKAEGWKWVEVMPQYDHGKAAGLRRTHPQPRELSGAEQEQLDALEAQYEELLGSEDGSADEECERLGAAIAAIRGEPVFDPTLIARAGVIVTLGHGGEPDIQRGYIRPGDDLRPVKATKDKDGVAPLSEKLVAELTAYRTLALRDILGVSSGLALTAVVHAFAASTFYPYARSLSCLRINARSEYLGAHASGIDETRQAADVQARHGRLAAQLPDDPDALWDHVNAMEQDGKLALLAHCVALTADTVHRPKGQEADELSHHAAQLLSALNADMTMFWEPTAKNYLGRVSKDRILEAVREGVSKEAAGNLSGMKKQAMAEAAAQRLAGKGWLPEVLRLPQEPAVQEAA